MRDDDYNDASWAQHENELQRAHEEWLREYDSLSEEKPMDMTKYAGSESKYLKASDLNGGRPQVVIEVVNLLEFEDEEKGKHTKPALKFQGKEKQLVVNATNCEELIRAFGADSDEWVGKTISLSTKYYKAFDREGIVVTPIVDSEISDDIPFN